MKIIIGVIILASVFLLTACDSGSKTEDAPEQKTEAVVEKAAATDAEAAVSEATTDAESAVEDITTEAEAKKEDKKEGKCGEGKCGGK
jgi:uncharacterized low-complexity protein